MWIDVSVALDAPHPSWPTSPGVELSLIHSLCDEPSQDTLLVMDVHSGTHIEASAHVIQGGSALGTFAADQICGRVIVLDGRGWAEVPATIVTDLPSGLAGILVKTDNSERALLRQSEFTQDFVGWSVELAEATASLQGLKFVGADYLSLQPYGGDVRVHTAILEAGIAIVEGLDLSDVEPGLYEMQGLFLSLPTREAAPARVLLKQLGEFQ